MHATWTLEVLTSGAENLVTLSGGTEPTADAAADAATHALVGCVTALGESGRQEYQLTADSARMIVTPGLNVDGTVDLVALREVRFPRRALGVLPPAKPQQASP